MNMIEKSNETKLHSFFSSFFSLRIDEVVNYTTEKEDREFFVFIVDEKKNTK